MWTLTDVRRELTKLQLDNRWPASVSLTDDELKAIYEKRIWQGTPPELIEGVPPCGPVPEGTIPVVIMGLRVKGSAEELPPDERFGYDQV